jgi:hypothetical protein
VFDPWPIIPTYIKILCELVVNKDFNKHATITSKYAPLVREDSFKKILYSPYNTKSIALDRFVNSIDIRFAELIPDSYTNHQTDNLLNETLEGQVIHTKSFKTQGGNIEIVMKQDKRYAVKEYNHFISDALPFAGYYYKGIMPHEIEQYFYYIGTGLRSEEYIKTISLRDLLREGHPHIAGEISEFASLEDDIESGKVKISVPQNNSSNNIQYKSINIRKGTIVSNTCVIVFKKESDNESY